VEIDPILDVFGPNSLGKAPRNFELALLLSPLNYSNEINTLQSCLSAIHVWFCENGMALNPTKSDAILFGTSQRLKTMSIVSLLLN